MPKTSTSRTPAKSRTAAPQKKARKQLTSGPTHSWCTTPIWSQELSKIGSSATVGAGMAHGVLTAVAVKAPSEQHTRPLSAPRRDWASGTW